MRYLILSLFFFISINSIAQINYSSNVEFGHLISGFGKHEYFIGNNQIFPNTQYVTFYNKVYYKRISVDFEDSFFLNRLAEYETNINYSIGIVKIGVKYNYYSPINKNELIRQNFSGSSTKLFIKWQLH